MNTRLLKYGLIALTALNLLLVSQNFSANADKSVQSVLPVEELRSFTEVFGRIKSDYVENVEDKKLIKEAINGMLQGLDPHSAYLDAEAFKELQVGTQGEFGGLGIEVGMEDGFVKVVAPIEDTPAFKAGLKAGDLIIKLDETAVKGLSLNDAVKRMRGKPNTSIKLTVLRKGESKPLVFELQRAIIQVKSVKTKQIEAGYASIRITQFQERTGENLAEAIHKVYKDNPGGLKGLVLDLRNDPGGLLNSAVAVSAAFLPQDALVVYTEGRAEDAKMRLTASREHYLRGAFREDYISKLPKEVKSVPIVVLVNNGTASASEIVAGALQDHKRAKVLGTQTFGKGSVQTILPLGNNTAIKLTTARYYTPNGRSIQAKGIVPDHIVEDPTLAGLESANVREADLERHLMGKDEEAKPADGATKKPEDGGASVTAPTTTAKPADNSTSATTTAAKSEPKVGPDGEKEDFQLNQAVNLLKGLPVLSKAN